MFEFTVEYWDDVDNVVRKCHGILAANSYADAAGRAAGYCSVPSKPGEGVISVYVSELDDILDWEDIMEMGGEQH